MKTALRCMHCGAELPGNRFSATCNECMPRLNRVKAAAYQAVYFAKRFGALPRLDGSIPCVDCGKPAKCYDHRNYSRPLDVQPVCGPCNSLRGPAAYLPAKAA